MLSMHTAMLIATLERKALQGSGSIIWSETVCEYKPLGWYTFVAVLLMIVAVGYTIIGLRRGKYVWEPLVLGLFALGLQLISALSRAMHYCNRIIDLTLSKTEFNAANLADFAEDVIRRGFVGLVMVMCGGFLSLVLCWQRRRRLSMSSDHERL